MNNAVRLEQSPSVGLPSYDVARFVGSQLPRVSNVHRAPAMSSLYQHLDQADIRCEEIVVEGAPTAVLVTRLGEPCRQPCRIAGRSCEIKTVPGLHTFLPPGADSWWGSNQATLSGWFHLHFSAAALSNAAIENDEPLDRVLVQADATLAALVGYAKTLTDAQDPPNALAWDSLSTLVLHRLCMLLRGARRDAGRRRGLAAWQARKVVDFLHENLARDLALTDLAGLVDLSPFHFARAFKATLGLPPHQYQVQIRMERARRLLRETSMSVLEVALAVGYNSPSSFARAFRESCGISPIEFRREP